VKKLVLGLGLVVLVSGTAPAPAVVASGITEYDRCMVSAASPCYPVGPWGIYIPNEGTPEWEAFEICRLANEAACVGLPGDPNNP
jgi:hypothetical protein